MSKSVTEQQAEEKHTSSNFASIWVGVGVTIVVAVAIAFIVFIYNR